MINITCRSNVPASLVSQKTYRTDEIVTALYEDFLGKCYLTEIRFSDKGLMEIDHFVTQTEDAGRVYDWSNLFPIHEKANKKRPKRTPAGGYLNPCYQQDDVEQDIIYRIRFDGTVFFNARDSTNLKAINTAKLLTHVHLEFKGAVSEKHNEVVTNLWEWKNAVLKGDTMKALDRELVLRSLLSRRSSFTMLMRAITDVPTEFFD